MGLRPCSCCRRRYRGKAQHAYPAVLYRGDDWRQRQSLCPSCFDEVKTWTTARLSYVNFDAAPEEDEGSNACVQCGLVDPDDQAQIFITLFVGGEVRGDYYGLCCESCRTLVQGHLGRMVTELV